MAADDDVDAIDDEADLWPNVVLNVTPTTPFKLPVASQPSW